MKLFGYCPYKNSCHKNQNIIKFFEAFGGIKILAAMS